MTNISNTTKIAERVSFIQEGGSSPASQPRYRGETSYDGWNTPLGDRSPTYLPSRIFPNEWDIVDITQGSEGLPTSGFTARVNDALYKKWRKIQQARCSFNIYAKKDDCGRKDDINSWQFINIFLDVGLTDFTDSALNPLQGDDQTTVELTGSLSARKEILVYPVRFETVGASAIDADVIDGFYAGRASCGGKCGERSDECSDLYVLTALNGASLGLSSQLVFTIDDKQTFTALDIPTLGGTSASAMANAGSFIIVVSENQNAHHYISFTDAQNENTLGWTKVETGYSSAPIAVYAKSPEEIFLCGNGGYIWSLESPTGSPTTLSDGSIVTDDLRHVDGFGSTVVFAGETGKVLVTQNNGDTITEKAVTLTDGTVLTGNVTALSVLSENIWFVAIGGKLYYTLNTGDTYAEKSLNSSITVINEIKFIDGVIGYLSTQENGAGRIYRSFDAGFSWSKSEPSVGAVPTAERFTAIAVCNANEVAIGGRLSAGGDGVLAIGE